MANVQKSDLQSNTDAKVFNHPSSSVTQEELLKDVEENTSTPTSEPKEKIKEFPVTAFPKEIQRIIDEFHKAFQLPKDYYGLGILTTCAGVIGNSVKLEYKPSYHIPAILYGAIVGSSSIGKTPALKLCLKPVFKIEETFEENYREELKEWEIEKKAAKKSNEIPDKPTRKDVLLNDATVEAINRIHVANKKGLLLFQDELVAWVHNLNAYRKGSDVEFWLSNWSNSGAKINRATSDPLFIPHPCVSVIGGLQPSVLDALASDGKKDNGFLFRVLFAYPDEQTKPDETDYIPSSDVFKSYENIVSNLNTINEGDTLNIKLSPDAREKYKKWRKENTDKINAEKNENIKSLFGKLEEYCLRFALILELLEIVSYGEDLKPNQNTTIQPDRVEKAIELSEYFRQTGLKVLHRIEKTDPLQQYTSDKQEFYNELPGQFTTEIGTLTAKKHKISERTFKRFLKDRFLFEKIKHGEYAKAF